MTNKRITELTALDGDDVANDDLLVIVDVSDTTMAASGTNKKITVAEFATDSTLGGAFVAKSTLTTDGDMLTRAAGVPARITRADLAQDSAFSSRYVPTNNDTVFWQAGSGIVTQGSPNPTRYATSYIFGGLLFDSANQEGVSFNGILPHYWNTFDIKLWWANDSTGAGDVVWQIGRRFVTAGDDSSTGASFVSVTATAGLNNVVVVTTGVSGQSNAAGEMLLLWVARIAGDAADTLANDAALLGVELVRAS